jgi:hypothetical protein
VTTTTITLLVTDTRFEHLLTAFRSGLPFGLGLFGQMGRGYVKSATLSKRMGEIEGIFEVEKILERRL